MLQLNRFRESEPDDLEENGGEEEEEDEDDDTDLEDKSDFEKQQILVNILLDFSNSQKKKNILVKTTNKID